MSKSNYALKRRRHWEKVLVELALTWELDANLLQLGGIVCAFAIELYSMRINCCLFQFVNTIVCQGVLFYLLAFK